MAKPAHPLKKVTNLSSRAHLLQYFVKKEIRRQNNFKEISKSC